MTQKTGKTSPKNSDNSAYVSWLPLVIIVMAQMQMGFNVNAIPVSVGPIVADLYVSATSVGTALVVYSLSVAAFVMVGAKLGRMFGERLVFQVTAVLHGLAMAIMALSQSSLMMNVAQALAGLSAAALVPTLVVLIAANYRDKQQAQALGILAGSPALSGALAFFVAGFLGTVFTWRLSFGILTLISFLVFFLSFRMKNIEGEKGIEIDVVGALLSGVAIVLISFGFNNLNAWGLVAAKDAAPFDLLGLSPAPFMILVGLMLGWGFFAWSNRRVAADKVPLLALEILSSSKEKATILSLLVIGALGPAVNFLIPLYIQIVQGQTSLFTAVAVVPYTLTIAASAMLIVRLYHRFTPRQIGMAGFLIAATGLVLLAVTISNEWSTPVVILGLLLVGLGEGSLLTLLFNVMVTSAPKELAGDVGALRGVANNLSTGLGTAFAGVVAVGLLSLFVTSALMQSTIPPSLKTQINLDNVDFVSNAQLEAILSETTATPAELAEAIQINEENRLRALRAAFLILAALAVVGLLPATGLPNYAPGEIPPDPATIKQRRGIRQKLRALRGRT